MVQFPDPIISAIFKPLDNEFECWWSLNIHRKQIKLYLESSLAASAAQRGARVRNACCRQHMIQWYQEDKRLPKARLAPKPVDMNVWSMLGGCLDFGQLRCSILGRRLLHSHLWPTKTRFICHTTPAFQGNSVSFVKPQPWRHVHSSTQGHDQVGWDLNWKVQHLQQTPCIDEVLKSQVTLSLYRGLQMTGPKLTEVKQKADFCRICANKMM